MHTYIYACIVGLHSEPSPNVTFYSTPLENSLEKILFQNIAFFLFLSLKFSLFSLSLSLSISLQKIFFPF